MDITWTGILLKCSSVLIQKTLLPSKQTLNPLKSELSLGTPIRCSLMYEKSLTVRLITMKQLFLMRRKVSFHNSTKLLFSETETAGLTSIASMTEELRESKNVYTGAKATELKG